MTSSTSYDTIKASFPLRPFVMSAVPNLHQLLLCRAHLNACARAHLHRDHSQGHLFLALPSQLYALETADAYPPRAADLGATVTYANNAGDVSRRRVENTFNVGKRDYEDKSTMYHALNKRLYEMLGKFSDDVQDEAKGICNPTFLQVYDLATAEWGYSTPEQRTANLDGITSTTGTDPKGSRNSSEEQRPRLFIQSRPATRSLIRSWSFI